MARRTRRANHGELNAWPGYVDALSTLLMVVTFVLLIFVLGQQFLSIALSRRSQTLDTTQHRLEEVRRKLSAYAGESVKLKQVIASEERRVAQLASQLAAANDAAYASDVARKVLQTQSVQAGQQMQLINEALVDARQHAMTLAAKNDELTRKLEHVQATSATPLAPYRSSFFNHLSSVPRSEKGVSVVGDRFVFESAVLFPQGSADLTPEGKKQLSALARSFIEVSRTIPSHIAWLLRVDGHADHQPIHTGFASNWELSSARAITVVKMLIEKGVDPHHLAATGFSDYQPLDTAHTPEAYAHNRRIEFRLTSR